MLPATTVIYAELPQPKQTLQTLLEHPLRQRIEDLDAVKQAKQGGQYQTFQTVLSVIEGQLGMSWAEAVRQISEGGIYLGLDGPSQGAVVMVHASNEQTLEKVLETLMRLTRDEADRQGQPDPIRQVDYRGITAYRAGEARFAVTGSWLLVTNKDELGKSMLDAVLDGRQESLAAKSEFQQARRGIQDTPSAWVYADVAAFRSAGMAEQLYRERTANPTAEILVGGILSNLRHTPYITAALYVAPHNTRLRLAAPHDMAWVSKAQEHFFGPDGKGVAPAAPEVAQRLLSVAAYRDFSQMWLYAGDLFDENVNDQLAQADSNLTTFFSGKDFGEEVLGAITPQVQFLAARQDFTNRLPQPTIKLPSFALIVEMRDPETTTSEFRRTYQSLIGFLNVIGAQNGQPQLDMEMDKSDGVSIVTAKFVPEEKERTSASARIQYNFSPTVAFAGSRMIISSTRELAEEVARLGKAPNNASEVNTEVDLNGNVLADVLTDNRESLIAQNMLAKGHGREAAEKEMDALFEVVRAFAGATITLSNKDNQLSLEVQVQNK